jgi:hypothetical protein
MWGATPTHCRITGHDIQERIKDALHNDWCVKKGVIPVPGTLGEEFWCPLAVAQEVIDWVTRRVEGLMGSDIVGCHSFWDAQKAISETCVPVANSLETMQNVSTTLRTTGPIDPSGTWTPSLLIAHGYTMAQARSHIKNEQKMKLKMTHDLDVKKMKVDALKEMRVEGLITTQEYISELGKL